MSKANRLSITNHATSKDALSNSEEIKVYDELHAHLKMARSLVYTVYTALRPEAKMAGETLSMAASECLHEAWERLERAAESVDRLDLSRMSRNPGAEKAHA